ncbi:unnamed protein product [Rotaria sordida]|uniref:Uncharacterized protein n=1 Tax=Rotaria sordida TaxID=392033 RepID=A0A814F608_9BILA|nr:unnamed protein product [Rotaria sordida]CAF1081807.1 unnamed protein product [Rotaria sordida]
MNQWHLCIYLFFLLSTFKSSTVHSIQCCSGDSSCTADLVDCPANVCFKLVFEKVTEYRGCMTDLYKMLEYPTLGGGNFYDDGGSSNDQCQKINTLGSGMSLCKCTSNLCNSSSKSSYISFLILIFILLVVYLCPCVFL